MEPLPDGGERYAFYHPLKAAWWLARATVQIERECWRVIRERRKKKPPRSA